MSDFSSIHKNPERVEINEMVSPQPSLAPKIDKEIDLGAKYLSENKEYARYTEKEAKRVLSKIDWHLMPIMTICITLAAADKIVISNAALYGMTSVLKNKSEYSMLGSIFYIGYLVGELPANLLLQRLPVGKCIITSFFFWNTILMLMATGNNFGSLAALRFLMGIGETFLLPGCTVITSMFYKKSEQGLRCAIWYSGFSFLITGILSYAIGHADVNIANWRLLFLVFGSITLFFTFFMCFLVPDSPMACRWLDERESYIAEDRTKENRTGTKNTSLKKEQVIEALTDYKSWLVCLFVLCFNIPNGALVTFAAQIVSGFGYSPLRTTLLGMPTRVFMTLSSFVIILPTLKIPRKYKSIAIALVGLGPLVCGILIKELNHQTINKNGLLLTYYLFYFYWGPYVGVLSLSMANTSGYTKKTIVNAMTFISYCVSNIIAPQFFKSSQAPGYEMGFNAILGFVAVGITTIIAYAIGCIMENRKRDAKYGPPSGEYNLEEDGLDLTDKQEEAVFRYSW
ncbi:hypothetical protein FOA43_000248 [Brettanomyces nanus]|uniref:Major facilitator superfamily (MFS) profile domain-containing protein n=1 Tax=Eeniella nana TaxID=13502 RepID=A0A875S0G0_EENNA|nr:uncharacterized protein FOA43_000248 [Brettanomyces nanus]QPG72944.1 hypothetical protein FOA43_000248 [Brettanomyces nanus]